MKRIDIKLLLNANIKNEWIKTLKDMSYADQMNY